MLWDSDREMVEPRVWSGSKTQAMMKKRVSDVALCVVARGELDIILLLMRRVILASKNTDVA